MSATQTIAPSTLESLVQCVADHKHVLAVGNQTKPAMCLASGATLISMNALAGVIEYQPSEFTFTAWSGTRLSEIAEMLHHKRQYLPFDPMLVENGATLGGTVASGISGPGRYRYGGIRDFILGVQLVTGDANVIMGGGKVVKNAAGFDIPKLMVGSLGRLGVMTQLTFKVFPKASSEATLSIACESHGKAVDRIREISRSRWELDAIDYRANERLIYLRLTGPAEAIDKIAEDIAVKYDATRMSHEDGKAFWNALSGLNCFDKSACLLRVPTTTASFLQVVEKVPSPDNLLMHLSVAGGVLWIGGGSDSIGELRQSLKEVGLQGLMIRGPASGCLIGSHLDSDPISRLRIAFDPDRKFDQLTL